MKIGEILSRLFFWGLGVIGGVGAYFNCPLVGEVESSVVRWLLCAFLAACCGVMVWYGLFLNRAEESDSESEYRNELKELDKTPLRKRIDGWAYAALLFALGGFMLYIGVDNLLEGKWLGFILYAVFGVNGNSLYDVKTGFILREYWVVIILGIVLSMPIAPRMNTYLFEHKTGKLEVAFDIVYPLWMLLLFFICVSFLVRGGYNPFIYFDF